MIIEVYAAGYEARHKERDYDPLGNKSVCEAIEKWDRLHRLAVAIADGNFNQAEVIREARALSLQTASTAPPERR